MYNVSSTLWTYLIHRLVTNPIITLAYLKVGSIGASCILIIHTVLCTYFSSGIAYVNFQLMPCICESTLNWFESVIGIKSIIPSDNFNFWLHYKILTQNIISMQLSDWHATFSNAVQKLCDFSSSLHVFEGIRRNIIMMFVL